MDINEYTNDSLRRAISYVPQNIELFSKSIYDNIRVSKMNASLEEVKEAAKAADAHDFIKRLPMQRTYLNKTKCKNKAASLLKKGTVKNMSKLGIAQEIFTHAILFYRATMVNCAGVNSSVINEIISHAKVVDIENGGDKWYRVVAYSALWYGNPSFA